MNQFVYHDIFLLSISTGKNRYVCSMLKFQIAVFLMDTQGTFDMQSTVFENAFIFALTLLVSSITVYNIMHNLQEDNLQHLTFFADYGGLAIDQYSLTPFQQLTFLIRDWQFEYENAYGFEGGDEVLLKRLEVLLERK